MSDTTPARNRTFKKERRAAKRDAIRWKRLGKKGRRLGGFVIENPPYRAGVGAWARHRRGEPDEPVRLKVNLTVHYK